MKRIFVLIFICVQTSLCAQPGMTDEYRNLMISFYSDSLARDSTNYRATWERVNIYFNVHFNLYTAPIKENKKEIRFEYEPQSIPKHITIDVVAELNKLIENKVVIKGEGSRASNLEPVADITIADYYYKRGQYFYLHNKREEALQDYKTAWELHPYKYLKERIAISLAAYYYTLDSVINQENLNLALGYIEAVSNPNIERNPLPYTSDFNYSKDTYEREKIMLLEITGNTERYVNYMKNLCFTHLSYYLKLIEEDSSLKDKYSYSVQYQLTYALDYLKQLHEFYVRHKLIGNQDNEIEKMLKLLVQSNSNN